MHCGTVYTVVSKQKNGHVVYIVTSSTWSLAVDNFSPPSLPFLGLPKSYAVFSCFILLRSSSDIHKFRIYLYILTNKHSYLAELLWAKQSYVSFISFPSGFLYIHICLCARQFVGLRIEPGNLLHF